ncbi:MAG: hypothetical protein LBI54_00485 [Lachnospiraceae bacterium]|jgi:hypothetical protein|nr:hypothetical protein [Lachnospiraceae bacterium]
MLYNDQNLDALYKAYKGKNKIIETEEIKEILDMYAVGKRPLSLLLGWGELTITRYIEGYVPTKPYSDVLKKVREDADYYMSVIESNKSLVAQPAYEKSMEAAKKIAKTQNENRANGKMVKKTLQIPEWMAKRAETAGLNLSAVLQDAIKAAL